MQRNYYYYWGNFLAKIILSFCLFVCSAHAGDQEPDQLHVFTFKTLKKQLKSLDIQDPLIDYLISELEEESIDESYKKPLAKQLAQRIEDHPELIEALLEPGSCRKFAQFCIEHSSKISAVLSATSFGIIIYTSAPQQLNYSIAVAAGAAYQFSEDPEKRFFGACFMLYCTGSYVVDSWPEFLGSN